MLNRKPFSNAIFQTEPVNMVYEDEDTQIINANSNTACQESLINDVIYSNPIASDRNVSVDKSASINFDTNDCTEDHREDIPGRNHDKRNIDCLQTQDTLTKPEGSLPILNDGNQILNADLEIGEEEQESYVSQSHELVEETVVLKIEEGMFEEEISEKASQVKDNLPPPSSSNIGNMASANIVSEVLEIAIPSLLKSQIGTQIQACKEISLKTRESLHDNRCHEETDTSTLPESNQRYNLRTKLNSKFSTPEEMSSDDNDEIDDDQDFMDVNYSSETTSDSEDNEDVKPLQQQQQPIDHFDNIQPKNFQSSQIKCTIMPQENIKFKTNETTSNSESDDEKLSASPTKRKRRRNNAEVSLIQKEKGIFKCSKDGCQKNFRNYQIYKEHTMLHRPGAFKCLFCEVVETNLIKLSSHEYWKHSKIKDKIKLKGKHQWICPRCSQRSTCSLLYQAHFANAHLDKNTTTTSDDIVLQDFKCYSDGCNKTFYNEQIYQNHKKLHENGTFQCTFCDIKESNLVKLSTHEYKTHTQEKKQKKDLKERRFQGYACPRCFIKFRYNHKKGKKLKVVSEEVNGIRGYRCETCKILFPNKRILSRHIQKSHKLKEDPTPIIEHDIPNSNTEPSKSDEKFNCYFCEITFEHAPDLAIHETEHAKVEFTQPKGKKQQLAEGMKFQCPRCPYKYNSQTIYIKHHLVNHLSTLADPCTMCSGGTIYIPNSKDHFDRVHNKNYLDDHSLMSECDECPAYFLKPFQLLLHKKRIHQQNTNRCQLCDKVFTKKRGLTHHLYHVHKCSDEDSKLPLGCDVENCKKRFSTLGELDLHKRYHRAGTKRKQGESTTCEECGKVCKSKLALSVHKRNVHSKKTFVCQECGKAFKSKFALNKHMLYHQSPDEWEFECTECGKKCATKDKLKDHQRTHTKEKPFVCQFCGEPYAHRHNWRNHLKTKHGAEEGAQEDINGIYSKPQGASFMSRKGSKKGDCIIAGSSTKPN